MYREAPADAFSRFAAAHRPASPGLSGELGNGAATPAALTVVLPSLLSPSSPSTGQVERVRVYMPSQQFAAMQAAEPAAGVDPYAERSLLGSASGFFAALPLAGGDAAGALAGLRVGSPYPPLEPLQQKRLAARRHNVT